MKPVSANLIRAASLAITLVIVGAGCPELADVPPEFDYVGPQYVAADFFPFAIGNFWLWNNIDRTDDWLSWEVILEGDVAGYQVWVVEHRHYREGVKEPEVGIDYIIEHPDGPYRAFNDFQYSGWIQNPHNFSNLRRLMDNFFLPGTHATPAEFDPGKAHTVGQFGEVTPFQRCDEDSPTQIKGGPEGFIIPSDHLALLTFAFDQCENGTRVNRARQCFGLGIGPVVKGGGYVLEYALVDEKEYALKR
jgi:hypothetical protein